MSRNVGRAPTTKISWDPGTIPPPQPQPRPPSGPCWHCLNDNHTLCTGVSCIGCTDPAHDRRPGVSGLSDGLAGGSRP